MSYHTVIFFSNLKENLRNENTTVPFNKQGPVKATKGLRSNRPVLANISNIQRRPALGTKLKVGVYRQS